MICGILVPWPGLNPDPKQLNRNHWKESKSESRVAQSCPSLCDPMGCNLQHSSVHGIFQARVPEWVAISFSRGSSQPRDQTRVSCIAGKRFTLWATKSICNAGDLSSVSGLGRSPGEEKGYPLQYSGLENLGCKESDTTEWLSLHFMFDCQRYSFLKCTNKFLTVKIFTSFLFSP